MSTGDTGGMNFSAKADSQSVPGLSALEVHGEPSGHGSASEHVVVPARTCPRLLIERVSASGERETLCEINLEGAR